MLVYPTLAGKFAGDDIVKVKCEDSLLQRRLLDHGLLPSSRYLMSAMPPFLQGQPTMFCKIQVSSITSPPKMRAADPSTTQERAPNSSGSCKNAWKERFKRSEGIRNFSVTLEPLNIPQSNELSIVYRRVP
uniref:Uncharacterized protein n=1 Tax=Craspedostauros australis TaxID=1486917 RepID=A0A7R9WSV9_9STRA|mmetsp:Transcript_19231/g.53442  ORF Transcript_19231/g.53442 Transcript_19231/m.53442 type:complete len:131 (+) Transcript_19231:475-867(+)